MREPRIKYLSEKITLFNFYFTSLFLIQFNRFMLYTMSNRKIIETFDSVLLLLIVYTIV